MPAPLIGFEGPIAAGKTTLAKRLSEHSRYDLVLERFDENEFLEDFYANKERWALPMQLWFLLERHKQLLELASRSRVATVADYTSIKNDVFAAVLLRGREESLYGGISSVLAPVRHPDILV